MTYSVWRLQNFMDNATLYSIIPKFYYTTIDRCRPTMSCLFTSASCLYLHVLGDSQESRWWFSFLALDFMKEFFQQGDLSKITCAIPCLIVVFLHWAYLASMWPELMLFAIFSKFSEKHDNRNILLF